MRLAAEITMDNDAFAGSVARETGRILRVLAERVTRLGSVSVGDEFKLMDLNGNGVGRARVFEN